MFRELWMSGVVLAFLSFGIKTGMGVGSRIFNKDCSRLSSWLFSAGTLVSYLVLFFALHAVVTRLNLLDYLDQLTGLIQYGMLVHLAVALGLITWGASLLMKPVKGKVTTSFRAGLFLVLPCPVCATVILLNLTLALSLSSLTPLATTLALFLFFFGIVAATLMSLFLFRRKKGIDNSLLGAAMVLIALYFFMTVLIAPIYPKLKPAFAMAASNNPVTNIELLPILILAGVSLALSGFGFARIYFFKENKK
ncbi:DUF2162 family putative transporter [Desulfospira joergensenii]|uniref:DUF2162 family putative transporter n=1 Tax=Desulfospira joergensenii TaxID=53329 RepID=UPI0003B6235A|nr:DUF2162 family putative transporter [Desulfospira joergensenii]